MRILSLALIGMFLFSPLTCAVTDTELQQAEETLRQMDGIISELRGYVQEAYMGKVGRITLTPEQKTILIEEYLNLKKELPILYEQLP